MAAEWKDDDLVYRQVHPTQAPAGVPSSQAFNPTSKDMGKLSVDDSRIVSAADSWKHFTEDLGFCSAGTWAVSFAEIKNPAGLTLIADPLDGTDEPSCKNPAHCLLDFNGMESKGAIKRRAQQLAIQATVRGCQFQATG